MKLLNQYGKYFFTIAPKAVVCLALLVFGSFSLRAQDSGAQKQRYVFGVGTNALYDLAITPNVSVEFPLGSHWSVLGEFTFPWWTTKDNSRAWQMLKLDIGTRYWFRGYPLLSGHFVGLDLAAGYYDIEPHHKGWQGEFQTAGVEYGYAWQLGKHWRMDTSIALGWLGSHYRYYQANSTDTRLIYQYDGRLRPWYFGPTKLAVSFKYLIPRHRRDKKKEEQPHENR